MKTSELWTPAEWLGVLAQLEDRAVELLRIKNAGGTNPPRLTEETLEDLCTMLGRMRMKLQDAHHLKQQLIWVIPDDSI